VGEWAIGNAMLPSREAAIQNSLEGEALGMHKILNLAFSVGQKITLGNSREPPV
jgi:hypothetical protein